MTVRELGERMTRTEFETWNRFFAREAKERADAQRDADRKARRR